MKLKISNHSSFNLKGTGQNPSGNFILMARPPKGGGPTARYD